MRKLFLSLILIIFLIGIISAQISYCCEKTIEDIDPDSPGNQGGWCVNAEEEQCDIGYRTAPTSCEATSYCKIGTCIDTKEGTCTSSPETTCGGAWDEREIDNIPQCQLGCCLIGEQAAFVTQTRCKKLSSDYGLEINYRTDINTEAECILSATADVKGACVYETDFERNCKMITRKECKNMPSDAGEAEFYEGYLCSAESLNTICGMKGGTTCVEGRDEVFFLDTCGNLANVYDTEKLNNVNYWTYLAGYGGVEVDCGSDGNADSSICGNCDYYLGSTCKKGNANYGDYICKDLKCTYEGDTYEHGETWCAAETGDEKINSVGGRHFRLVCYNNEVTVEPCADYRQEVCLESWIDSNNDGQKDEEEFSTAACRVNQWQDCYSQDNQKDCENSDRRDCKWIVGTSILKDEKGKSLAVDENGNKIDASCVPLYAPGFDFWEEGGDAESMCSLASTTCVVKYEQKIGGSKICVDGCECADNDGNIRESWKKSLEELCVSLGDCGSKTNYIGDYGYYDWEKSFAGE